MTASADAPVLRDVMPATTSWSPRESRVTLGVARGDITPPVGVRAHNWGASRVEVATGVHRPLTASAIAFWDTGASRWRYVLTTDLGWWQDAAAFEGVRDPLIAELGIEPDDLLLHLVHTHAGPSISDVGLDLPGAALLKDYRAELIATLAGTCRTAREQAVDTVVTWAYGHHDLAVVRNLPCGQRDVVAFDPDATADDVVLVGRAVPVSPDSTSRPGPSAIIVNYACHPTTLAHHNSLLSPDYIGATREVVETDTGAVCVFVQGASGELSPREQYVVGPEVADRHGRGLGHAVLATVNTMGEPGTALRFDGVVESGAPLGIWEPVPAEVSDRVECRAEVVELPARAMDGAGAPDWSSIDTVAAAERRRRSQRLAAGYVSGGVARHRLWIWRLGDAVIVAHPGEAFSLLQTALRAAHPGLAVAVLNLTNGPGSVYLPDRESYGHDRYQVWQTLVAPGGLETMIERASTVIAELAEPGRALS